MSTGPTNSLASPPVFFLLSQPFPSIPVYLFFLGPSQSTLTSGFFHLIFILPEMPCPPQLQGQFCPSFSSGLCSSVIREDFLHHLKNTALLSLPIDFTYIFHSTYHLLTFLCLLLLPSESISP